MPYDKDAWSDEIENTEPTEEDEPDMLEFEIMNYPADTTLKGYKDMFDNKQIKIPEFQRNYVWDQVRASKLIESFLLGLPVPGIFLYKERNGAQHIVIDGNQRLQTICYFFDERFNDENKIFKLKNVAGKWVGKKFSDLSDEDKFKFETAVLRATIINQVKPDDNSSIYYIFERLNTGGVNLNPMEVRMCVSEGDFSNLLKSLNKETKWRTLINQLNEDKRLRDIELVLRFFALRENYKNYEKPMKRFLNDFIKDKRNISDEKLTEYRNIFIKTIDFLSKLEERPFNFRSNKLNYAVLDSMMVAASYLDQDSHLTDGFNKLKQDASYLEIVSKNTSDKHQVLTRIEKAFNAFGLK